MSKTVSGPTPIIAVMVIVGNSEPKLLLELLFSLIHQKYPGWECRLLVNDSASPYVAEIATSFSAKDGRFQIMRTPALENRAELYDLGLDVIGGDYVTIAEDSGIFSPLAFLHVVSLLMKTPGKEVVFADDDIMDDEGFSYSTCVKSGCPADWLLKNITQFPSVYINNDYLRANGGFSKMVSASHEVVVRDFANISRVLYHCRDLGSVIRTLRLAHSV